MLRRTSPARLSTYTAKATTVVVTNTSASSPPGGKGGTEGTRRGSGFTATVTTKSKKPNKAAAAAAQQQKKKKKKSVNVQHINEHDSAAKEEPLSCIVPIVSGPDLIRPSGKSNSVWSADNEEGTLMPPAAAGAAFLSSTDLAFRFAPTRNFGIRSVNTNAPHARIDDGSGVSDMAIFSLTSSSSWDNTIQERLWIQVLYTNPNTNTTHDSSQSAINNYTVVNAIELPSVGVHLTASPGGDRIGVVLADGSVLCYDIISFYDDDADNDDDDDQGQVVVSILPRWSVPFMVSPTKMEAASSSLYIAPIRTFEVRDNA